MEGRVRRFIPLSVRPHWMQLVISQIPCILLCVIIFAAYMLYSHIMFLNLLLLYTDIALVVYLLYRVIYYMRMEYVITGDQLIFLHGVVSHSTDYMELYRVIDYQQHRSLMQQLFNIKTVIIYSGDRNMPIMNIIGVKEKVDLVKTIRERVEYNKNLKHIYEITNRP